MAVTISLDPVILQIGLVQVRWYGLMLALGFLVAFLVAARLTSRRRLKEDDLFNLMLWIAVAAVVGARLSYILQAGPAPYLADPMTILTAWQSGLDFYGGLLGGMLAALLYARLRCVALLPLTSVVAVALPLGHAFTRLGCLLNGCASGTPVASGLRFIYTSGNSLATQLNTGLAPTQLYELLWDLLLLAAVLLLRRRVIPDGLLLWGYLGAYSLGRVLIYIWRDEPAVAGPLRANQLVALAWIALSAAAMFALLRRPAKSARLSPVSEA